MSRVPLSQRIFGSSNADRLRRLALLLWLALLGSTGYTYLFHQTDLELGLEGMLSLPALVGGAAYVVASCLRGFTLIPSTLLLLAGLPLFPPGPFYVMTMIGIGVSASSVYFFSQAMGLDKLFEYRDKALLARAKEALHRNQFSIVIGWSFFPFVPTDLICYACGSLRTEFKRFLLAVLIGEGLICAVYIFLADQLLHLLHLR
jgi:uncharacterized membrane protein YdjX (TVP38/TMEM64 family)